MGDLPTKKQVKLERRISTEWPLEDVALRFVNPLLSEGSISLEDPLEAL